MSENTETATEDDSPTATAEDIAEKIGADPEDVREWLTEESEDENE